ncbi:AAA domain-containing protein [Gymnopilus junonius]|uniref:AAA domain-containing protein n=1 Tax=Gymnopilus junonius TaxID=109634 RepID=A0A9P5TSJ3_GYMJU|nr:AAA domain-containing protein [Gymnopilus junonius]
MEQQLGGEPSKNIANEIRQIQQEVESIKQERRVKVAQLQTSGDNISRRMILEDELKVLQSRRDVLATKLDSMKDKQKSDFRSYDTRRRVVRNEILTQADVVCSTLSGAGHDILASLDFDMIIIDEAAQAIELSSLIPLKYRFSRCVMVGDPKQLPPTVLSQEITTNHFSCVFNKTRKNLFTC